MAHKTETSREYPWPPEVARIIYDYYFDAPEILAAGEEFYALCVDGTLHVCPRHTKVFTYTDIESIASNELDPGSAGSEFSTCVVIKRSGDIFTRGYDCTTIDEQAAGPTLVYHTPDTFAVRFSNGDQVFWGDTDRWQPNLGNLDLSEVDTLFSNDTWFAALMKDKTVQTWPANDAELEHQTEIDSKELKGVVRIYSTWGAFAALKDGGEVISWGDMRCGGDSSDVGGRLTEVKDICNTNGAFAALKEDGTAVAWGDPYNGGDSSGVGKELEQVEKICATDYAFAARRRDRSIVTWGHNFAAGVALGSASGIVANLPPVLDIYSTEFKFGARTRDNGFVTWQHPDTDILFPMREALGSRNVTQIYSHRDAFAVITDTKAAVAYRAFRLWYGSGDVTDIGSRPRIRVVSQRENFLATIDTGDVVVWGQSSVGHTPRQYADIINEHQSSIRKAFKSATGYEAPVK